MEFLGRARVGVWVAALLCGTTAFAKAPPSSRVTKHAAVLTLWEQAQRARAGLEAQAESLRTRVAYTRVLDLFRAIYHDNPRDPHAAEAVYSVAELLAEQGRDLEDAGSVRAAVGQYEFLRTQYPASPLGPPALLTEGRIEADDLRDAVVARAKWNQLLREAPRSEAARQARVELAGVKTPASAGVHPTHAEESGINGAPGLLAGPKDVRTGSVPPAHHDEGATEAPGTLAGAKSAAAVRKGPLAQVTGIRHWSTATYTRVAIDLGDEVTFEAARVPGPDRLFFDLHGAKLDSALVGKTFDVTDDGFLKRIRAAQAGGDVTRVVLDVSDVSEYSAFLLPNPYRLIIDIHGRKMPAQAQAGKAEAKVEPAAEVPVAPAAVKRASAAANSSGLPAMALTDGGEAVRPAAAIGAGPMAPMPMRTNTPAPRVSVVQKPTAAKPVPNAVAVSKPQTATEVAAVSDSPGKVEATDAPTSKPIAVREVSLGEGSRKTRGKATDTAAVAEAAPVRAADKTADGETSLIRALGLKIGRIVIDAGHGGHDSGTIGAGGIEEKDVVLDVALRLGKLLHERLGAEIIYTRSDDTFIPLETRTAIANKAQADLFLSIHANSSADPTARGVETYYLNFTSDPMALDVAARENAVSGQSIHQLSDLVKKITLKDKIAESHEFAADVEDSLYAGLTKGNAGLKNRGVKKAPFVVLIGANMPSILAEISFVTNPRDADQLRQPEYRERVAESLYSGVAKYESGLAGTPPVAVKRASLQ